MKRLQTGARLVMSLAAATALNTASAAAQAGGGDALPPARQLIEKHLTALGGRDAILAHQSMHAKGSFSMPAMGLTGTFDVWQAAPNRMASAIEVPGIGLIRRGFDGKIGWSSSPIEGARLIEGKELAQLKDEASMKATVRDTSLVASATTVEKTEAAGKPCYSVRITWKSGRETTDCYAVDTGLLVSTRGTAESTMGSIETVTIYEDYTKFGKFMMPSRNRQQMMGQEQIISIDTVEFDTVQPGAFDLPADVKALVGGG